MPQENKDWKSEFRANFENIGYPEGISDFTMNELIDHIQNLLDKQRNEVIKLLSQDIGMLRQWLNEDRITDPNKMVTNEEIKVWFNVLTEIKKGDKGKEKYV